MSRAGIGEKQLGMEEPGHATGCVWGARTAAWSRVAVPNAKTDDDVLREEYCLPTEGICL
jgi:hypothetical protein